MDPSTTEDATAGGGRRTPTQPQHEGSSSTDGSGQQDIPDEGLAALVARRDGGELLPGSSQPLDLSGTSLVGLDLSGLDLSRARMVGANLMGTTLAGSRLVSADLRGAFLHNIDLTGAELLQADLSGADLTNATLDRAGLGQSTAVEAVFFGIDCDGATFTGADLTASDFRAARMHGCRARDVNLTGVDFTNSTLTEVDFGSAKTNNTVFRGSQLRGTRLSGITGYKTCDWINADIHEVDFTGAWLVRRHIQDENYLHEFRTQSSRHERLYRLWSITSDCGRSLSRWSLWTVLVAVVYAGLYTQVDIDWGDHRTLLSPLYYSVVTFTTLGYGDVAPGSTAAQLMAMSEVVFGYFSLGGMMSILSDKMARRAG